MSKTVLITWWSRGIGRAISIEFAKKWYNIIIDHLSDDISASLLKQQLEQDYGVNVLVFSVDVSNEEWVKEMIENSLKVFGSIDVLVNNAWIVFDKEFTQRTVHDRKRTLDANLIWPFIISKYVGEFMYKQKSGKIITISSTNGINTYFPSSVDYDASKAALINLTKNLAVQFSPYVNVNSVAPGWVKTEMNKELPLEFVKEEEEKILLKRFAEPEEIAKVVVFLSSDDASYITGSTIVVDWWV